MKECHRNASFYIGPSIRSQEAIVQERLARLGLIVIGRARLASACTACADENCPYGTFILIQLFCRLREALLEEARSMSNEIGMTTVPIDVALGRVT